MSQPPRTSKFRSAAANTAAGLLIRKGILPDHRVTIPRYWKLWMSRAGVTAHSEYEKRIFWSVVLTKVSLKSINTPAINTAAIFKRVKVELMPESTLDLTGEEHRIERIILGYFSKRQVKVAVHMLGTILSMVAHRCDIAGRDFPVWYTHVWLTWMWLSIALRSSSKVPDTSINEVSSIPIRKVDDKIMVDGVQYTHKEAHHLVTKLSSVLYKEITKP